MSRMNVLMIVSDQHHAGVMGCAGHPVVRTPNLDRLAGEGVLFERAFCSNPLCVPARTSLLTGRYCVNHGVYSLGATFRDDMPTLAHLFAASGYDTTLAGRMHFVWADRLHGFARRTTPEPYGNIFNCREYWRDPIHEWDFTDHHESAGPGSQPHLDSDRKAQASALDVIREGGKDRSKPWMLMRCFTIPHSPYNAPAEYYEMYDGLDFPTPPPFDPDHDRLPVMYATLEQYKGRHKYTPGADAIRRATAAYFGLVTAMDDMIGEMLDLLESTGQLQNTLIVYTSDHGDMLGAKGCWHKSYLYNPSIRVPLIVSGAGIEKRGERVRAPVSHVDLFPTAAHILGIDLHDDLVIDGRSLAPWFNGDPQADEWPRRGVLVEYADYGARAPMAAWIEDRWKLTCAEGHEPLLHDLDADPDEERDLAGDPACRDILDRLRHELGAVWDHRAVRRRVLDCQYGFTLIEKAHERQGLL